MKLKLKALMLSVLIIGSIGTISYFIFNPLKVKNFDSISIGNNRDFKKYDFAGEGTAENPYIIKGYNLINPNESGLTATAIYVSDTSKHFIITDCIFKDYYRAIKIRRAKAGTGTIMNNTILAGLRSVGWPSSGIELEDSDEVYIFNNSINSFYEKGILFFWSNNCTIERNYISLCGSGLLIYNSQNNLITGNYLKENNAGISLSKSNNTEISNNYLDNIAINIGISAIRNISVENRIMNNTCINAFIGINISIGCKNFTIASNTISNNSYGLISAFNNSSVYSNNYYQNQYGGIELTEESYFNLVYKNNFIENHPLLEFNCSQAVDNGNSNNWFHQTFLIGNYWSNIGDNFTYLINGTAVSYDLYPLTSPQELISFSLIYSHFNPFLP